MKGLAKDRGFLGGSFIIFSFVKNISYISEPVLWTSETSHYQIKQLAWGRAGFGCNFLYPLNTDLENVQTY
jgi:hypothetical protein